jgi:phosphoglycolate phosphatase
VVLFDLDGTLVDSAPDLAAALNLLLTELDRACLTQTEVKPLIGDGIAKMVERGLDATGGLPGDGALGRHIERYRAIYGGMLAERTRPYPGVRETLAALRRSGHRLGVVTNKPVRASRALVAALDLADYFDAIAGGDSYAVHKPHPGHLLELLAELGAEPGDAVMVGDSEHDVAAARSAGIPVVLMTYGYGGTPAAQRQADAVLDDFAALPGALKRLSR